MTNIRLCECGCGQVVRNRFVQGHHMRVNNHMLGRKYSIEERMKMSRIKLKGRRKKLGQFCECGCGGWTNYKNRFIYGHNIRIDNPGVNPSEEKKKKLSDIAKKKYSKNPESNPMFGRKHSKESKDKMSEALKGRKCPWNQDKPLSVEVKRKISKANKGTKASKETKRKMSIMRIGSGNANWRGGISFEPYCHVWADREYKEDIKRRDGFKCQNPDCFKKFKELVVHHINYNKKDCEPSDLVTLCISCNSKANYNREYWKDLYQGIVVRFLGEREE